MDATTLTAYRTNRARGLTVQDALGAARWMVNPPAYGFLADLDAKDSTEEQVNGWTVRVRIVPDDVSRFDDDVTGTFTDTRDSRVLKNKHRDWNSDAAWYLPSNVDQTDETYRYLHDAGMSKQVARETAAEQVRQAMSDDAHRYYYGVLVEVAHRYGPVLGTESLWGVDVLDDDRRYLIGVADDLVDLAVDYAETMLDQLQGRLS